MEQEGVWPPAPECGQEASSSEAAETEFWKVESSVVERTEGVETQHPGRMSRQVRGCTWRMLLECLCQRVQVSTVDGGLEEVDGVCDYQKTAKGRQEISFYPQCVYLHVGARKLQCMELLL